jgi:hypothetical protein
MRYFVFAFIFSVILHLLVITAVLRRSASGPDGLRVKWIDLYSESPAFPTDEAPKGGRNRGVFAPSGGDETAAPKAGQGQGNAAAEVSGGGGDSWRSGIPIPVPESMVPLRSPFSSRNRAPAVDTDSLVQTRIVRLFSGLNFSSVGAAPDPAGDLNRKRSGAESTFKPGGGDRGGYGKEEKNETRFDFLPSEVQIRALTALYRKPKATQNDLYLELDSSTPTTVVLFNRELDALVAKGFMARKIVSPQNLFVIGLPFGGIPIEMSRKNKLNPVYEYKSMVPRGTLMAFLQSTEFFLHERLAAGASADTAWIRSVLNACERDMAAVAKDREQGSEPTESPKGVSSR